MAVRTFSVCLCGGSVFRVAISTLPFLLPLMFQLAFGLCAYDAGLLVLAVFAGNLAMKTFTTAVMQRWGFRPVLMVNCGNRLGGQSAIAARRGGVGVAAFIGASVPLHPAGASLLLQDFPT